MGCTSTRSWKLPPCNSRRPCRQSLAVFSGQGHGGNRVTEFSGMSRLARCAHWLPGPKKRELASRLASPRLASPCAPSTGTRTRRLSPVSPPTPHPHPPTHSSPQSPAPEVPATRPRLSSRASGTPSRHRPAPTSAGPMGERERASGEGGVQKQSRPLGVARLWCALPASGGRAQPMRAGGAAVPGMGSMGRGPSALPHCPRGRLRTRPSAPPTSLPPCPRVYPIHMTRPLPPRSDSEAHGASERKRREALGHAKARAREG